MEEQGWAGGGVGAQTWDRTFMSLPCARQDIWPGTWEAADSLKPMAVSPAKYPVPSHAYPHSTLLRLQLTLPEQALWFQQAS